MQPVAHTTSRDFLAVSTGALEVLEIFKAQLKCSSLTFFNPLTQGRLTCTTCINPLMQGRLTRTTCINPLMQGRLTRTTSINLFILGCLNRTTYHNYSVKSIDPIELIYFE